MASDLTPPATSRPPGTHLPIALLSMAIAVFLIAQIAAVGQQAKIMTWQMGNGQKQLEVAKTNETTYNEQIKMQSRAVDELKPIQDKMQEILSDILKLEKEDNENAKILVSKWKIQPPAKPADKDKP